MGAFRLLRPGNALVSAAAVLVGAYLATTSGMALLPLLAGMVAAFCFAAAGNVRNDLGDIEVDRVAHPERPLVRGDVTLRTARALPWLLYGVALLAGALVSWQGALLVALALPVMESYERWGKARGLPGNLAVALLTAAPFVLGGLVARHVGPALLAVAALAALATAGREVLKDVEDADADAGARRTLPHQVGARRASIVAAGFLVAAALLSPLPWLLENVLAWAYLPAVAAADACFLLAAAIAVGLAPGTPGRAQRLAKLGMVAALAALTLGRALAGGVV